MQPIQEERICPHHRRELVTSCKWIPQRNMPVLWTCPIIGCPTIWWEHAKRRLWLPHEVKRDDTQ